MRSNKVSSYEPGDVVAVPLERGGYGAALVAARWEKKKFGKGIALFYGFDKLFKTADQVSRYRDISPTAAINVQLCSDATITSGRWPVVHHQDHFDASDWPAPPELGTKEVSLLKVSTWESAEIPIAGNLKKPELEMVQSDVGLGVAGYLEFSLDAALRDRTPPDYFPVTTAKLKLWSRLYRKADRLHLFEH